MGQKGGERRQEGVKHMKKGHCEEGRGEMVKTLHNLTTEGREGEARKGKARAHDKNRE